MLVFVMLSCSFIACNNSGNNENETNQETKAKVSITVSFKVKDKDGKIIAEQTGYKFDGANPTVLAIIDDYFTIIKDWEVKSTDGTLESIGEYKADSEYIWAFYMGTTADGKRIDDKKMGDYEISDGDGFTVYLDKL